MMFMTRKHRRFKYRNYGYSSPHSDSDILESSTIRIRRHLIDGESKGVSDKSKPGPYSNFENPALMLKSNNRHNGQEV